MEEVRAALRTRANSGRRVSAGNIAASSKQLTDDSSPLHDTLLLNNAYSGRSCPASGTAVWNGQ